MIRFAAVVIVALLATACAPVGGGDGIPLEAHTGWRGLMSVGPASADGAIRCGLPDRSQFTCEDGASVKRGKDWMGCVIPGQRDVSNGSTARGDFVLLDWRGRVIFIGRNDGDTMTRAACARNDELVETAWVGWVSEVRPGFPKVDEVCWNPDTGERADCAAMGR